MQLLDRAAEAIESGRQLSRHLQSAPLLRTSVSREILTATVTSTGNGLDFLPMLPLIASAAAVGHECSLHVADEPDLRIGWSSKGEIGVEGSASFLADPNDRTALARHIEDDAVDEVVALLGNWRFTLTAILRHTRDGVGWIHDLDRLVESLCSSTWWPTLSQLTKVGPTGRTIFVVDGLQVGESVDTAAFKFVSPEELDCAICEMPSTQLAQERQGASVTPRPSALLPPPDCNSLALSSALARSANALAWISLASASTITQSSILVLYQGVRDVRVDLTSTPPATYEQALSAVRLWEWSGSGQDVMRVDAAQRATTLAVVTADDLPRAADAVLRTARTLYEIAARGVIAEALNARRSGREAAANAARAAAGTAREAATKATERSLALMAAAAGVVFAALSKVVDWQVAVAALAVLSLFLVGTSIIALRVDFQSATESLSAFDSDVDQYREALSGDDIQSLKQLEVLSVAKNIVRRARVATLAVYWASAVLAILFAGLFLWRNSGA